MTCDGSPRSWLVGWIYKIHELIKLYFIFTISVASMQKIEILNWRLLSWLRIFKLSSCLFVCQSVCTVQSTSQDISVCRSCCGSSTSCFFYYAQERRDRGHCLQEMRPCLVRLWDNVTVYLLLRSGEFVSQSILIQYSLWILFDTWCQQKMLHIFNSLSVSSCPRDKTTTKTWQFNKTLLNSLFGKKEKWKVEYSFWTFPSLVSSTMMNNNWWII